MRAVLLFLSICSICLSCTAATYYVRTDGNNGNAGTANTAGGAWLTIQKAASTAVAGDVVRVQPGGYPAFVTAANSGTGPSAMITFLADGAGVGMGGWDISGKSYIQIIGFEITNLSTCCYSVKSDLYGNKNQIIDCWIHDSPFAGITLGHNSFSSSNVVRGNIITNMGYSSSTGTNSDSNACVYNIGTNNLIEYNDMARASDFVAASRGLKSIIRNNYMHDTHEEWFSTPKPHVDMCESQNTNNDPTNSSYSTMVERNCGVSNMVANGHMGLFQDSDVSLANANTNLGHFIWRLNSCREYGSGGVFSDGGGDMKFYNNTLSHFALTSLNNNSHFAFAANKNATNAVTVNNLFYQAGSSIGWLYSDGGTSGSSGCSADGSAACNFRRMDGDTVMTGYSYMGTGEAHGRTNDPLIVGFPDFHLQANAPPISNCVYHAITTGSGSGSTSLVVDDSRMFMDGWSITTADSLDFSGNTGIAISSINYSSSTITLATACTWTNNAPVFLSGVTNGGAFPEGSADLTAATLTQKASTYTVTTTGSTRGVWFYVNGIPDTWMVNTPYVTNYSSGTITAKAYALYAQTNPVVAAVAVGPYSGQASGKMTLSGKATLQ